VRFLDDHTLEIGGGDRIEAKRIVIATGSRTNCPTELEGLGDRVVVTDDLFRLGGPTWLLRGARVRSDWA
jgi:dihydrolipoamide dehydrogenase